MAREVDDEAHRSFVCQRQLMPLTDERTVWMTRWTALHWRSSRAAGGGDAQERARRPGGSRRPPIAVGLSGGDRSRWFANLAELVVERVSDDVATIRRADALRRFLKLTAASTGQTRNAAELGREVGLGREQAMTYLRLLELVYVAFELPAWSVNLSSRVTKRLASRTPNLLLEV